MPEWLWRRLSRLTGIDHLENLYRQLPSDIFGSEFAAAALRKLGVEWSAQIAELEQLPASGGLVVAANHPYGGIDGLAAIAGLSTRRSDLRVLATTSLAAIPALHDIIIPVDNFGRRDSRAANLRSIRAALRHVHGGGALLLFPAGEVSHLDLGSRQIVDPPWKKSAVALILAAAAPVVPLYVHGSNSLGFQLAGLLHPSLRTALLPREVVNKRGAQLDLRFGTPISVPRLRVCEEPERVAQLLRIRLYSLAAPRAVAAQSRADRGSPSIIASAGDPRHAVAEIDHLKGVGSLLSLGTLEILVARGDRIPALLHEIGRQREITFRAVGEGTGEPVDIDRHDQFYEHLIAWDNRKNMLVGGYRIARVNEVIRRFGRTALYLGSLFEFREPFFKLLGPTLELGRSFVRPEYQRSFAPLLALWRGIGEYVARNPRYSKLIGPVSVSADYDVASRDLMVRYLRWHHFDPVLGALVKPRSPYRHVPSLAETHRDLQLMSDIDQLSPLLSDVRSESEQRAGSVPVLLRQYLKLGGRVLSFNVDASFGHCVDFLTLVDLCKTPDTVLGKYMTAAGLRRFREYHQKSNFIKSTRHIHQA